MVHFNLTNGSPFVTTYSVSLVKISKPISLELVTIISAAMPQATPIMIIAAVTRIRRKRI